MKLYLLSLIFFGHAFASCPDLFSGKAKVELVSNERVDVNRSGKITPYLVSGRGLNNGNDMVESISDIYPSEILDLDFLYGRKVLDAGCGKGAFVKDLQKLGVLAQGIDIHLNEDLKKEENLFSEADMAQTKFQDGEFDFIYSTWSVFMYERKDPALLKKILKEFNRILKIGGRIRLGPVSSVTSRLDIDSESNIRNFYSSLISETPELKINFIGKMPDPASRKTIFSIEIVKTN